MTLEKKNLLVVMALLCGVMALAELIQQRITQPTGRWAFIFAPIWDAFGWPGLVAYWLFLAFVFGIIFFIKGRR